MNRDGHRIWSNADLDLDDWREDLLEEAPDASEIELLEMMYERNEEYLQDERINLNIQFEHPILVIGNLGRWNGRGTGYKEIPSGNVRDCLRLDTDYASWYVDKQGDLRCDAIHHDGVNHYRYRAYRPRVTQEQMEALKDKIYEGTVTEADIDRYTRRLGDSIGKVYGWSFPRPKRQQER